MVQKDNVPNHLTVVSSDHRIQIAAKRKRATVIDSDVWYNQLARQPIDRNDDDDDEDVPTSDKLEPLRDTDELFDLTELNRFEKRLRERNGEH